MEHSQHSIFSSLCLSLRFLFSRRPKSDVHSQLPSLVLEQQLRSADTCADAPSDERPVLDREWTLFDGALGSQRSSLRFLCCRTCTCLPPQHGSIRQPAGSSKVTAAVRPQLKVSYSICNLSSPAFISSRFQIASRPNSACLGECGSRLLQLPDDW
jgi:hypothetical protein